MSNGLRLNWTFDPPGGTDPTVYASDVVMQEQDNGSWWWTTGDDHGFTGTAPNMLKAQMMVEAAFAVAPVTYAYAAPAVVALKGRG